MDPSTLPIYNHEEDILRAVNNHRVVVIEGPTGSGKTTQLPKILLKGGVTTGIIGVTQPRRIAAVSVAWRIAEELNEQIGAHVGYSIRFDDRSGPDTLVKIMTDGILLQEARTDPEFSRYGVIVVDEAHERSLNIDFTLGLLHRALTKRDDLKVIVSSATIRPEVFQRYFETVAGEVPFVSIDARPYPVELRYHPPQLDTPFGVIEAVADEISRIHHNEEPGAVLAFLSGQAMIRGVADLLAQRHRGRQLEVMPLYGKLTREEQERVFEIPDGPRKVVLATNIAETSITIPDVRFVVDTGLAKVPRVHRATGVTALREEGISRASAEQRAGRAGRTQPGVAVRLYSKHSFEQRAEYIDEEILRLDLSNVALRLIHLGIRDIERFPFPTQPSGAALKSAISHLQSMGAIDGDRHLTQIGERMMPFPLSPTLARMVVEAADHFPTVVDEVLMVGAFLSSRPPFLYPQGEETEARAAQRYLAHPSGDALTAVNTLKRYLSNKNPQGFCERNYLDPDIMGFIAKVHRQLSDIARDHGIDVRRGGDGSQVVRALMTGFAHRLLRKERGRLFESATGLKVAIHPSSAFFGERASFIVAAEIVVSTRAYARQVSAVEPEWIAQINPELARAWQIRTRGKKKKKHDERRDGPLPEALTLGAVTLGVSVKKGRPNVTIPLAVAKDLTQVQLSEVPTRALSWRAELRHQRWRWGRGGALAEILCLLPHIPLPTGPPKGFRGVALGDLLEVDRDIHHISRSLDRLLQPGLPAKGNRPGWLALLTNSKGGFWYEVVSEYPDALAVTLEATRRLGEALADDDPLAARVEAMAEGYEQRLIAIDRALDAARHAVKRR